MDEEIKAPEVEPIAEESNPEVVEAPVEPSVEPSAE